MRSSAKLGETEKVFCTLVKSVVGVVPVSVSLVLEPDDKRNLYMSEILNKLPRRLCNHDPQLSHSDPKGACFDLFSK